MSNSVHSNSADYISADSSTPAESHQFKSRLYFFIVLSLFSLFAFQLWFHATRTSATIDESPHILSEHRRREAHIPLCGVKITGIGAREQA